jgi:arabinofuranosyltransferase
VKVPKAKMPKIPKAVRAAFEDPKRALDTSAIVLVVLGLLVVHGVYAGVQYWLCDDAFISFRYVRNFVDGHGLVWNRGEYVEGYTNFAWVLELAFILWTTGIRPEIACTVLSILFTVGTFVVTAMLAWSTPFPKRRTAVVLIAIGFLCLHRSFAVWATSGLETRQFTFFLVLGCLLLRRVSDRPTRYVPASLAFVMAALTRPEAWMLWGMALAWLVFRQTRAGKVSWREIGGFALPFLLAIALHTVFRLAYYGDLLPNTYYAKAVRPWPEAGAAFFVEAGIETGLYLVIPLALVGLAAREVLAKDGQHSLSAVMIGPHALYLFELGGDHFEFRPLDFWWPLLAVACADAIVALATWLEGAVRARAAPWADWAWRAGATAGCVVLAAYAGLVQFAHFCLTYDLNGRDGTYRIVVPLDVESFPALGAVPFLDRFLPAYNAAQRYCAAHSVAARWIEHREFWRVQEQVYGVYEPYVTAETFPDDAVAIAGSIGVYGYAVWSLTIIDGLGLTDRTIAHYDVVPPNADRQMAHDRSAPPGYLESRGVNLGIEHAQHSEQAAFAVSPYVIRLSDDLWMPLDVRDHDWIRSAFAGRNLLYRRFTANGRSDHVMVDGRMHGARLVLGTFESGLDGWTVEGDLGPQPAHGSGGGQSSISGFVGGALVNTYAPGRADDAVGSVTSPDFEVEDGDALVALVGGGASPDVAFEVECDGTIVGTARGRDVEHLELHTFVLGGRAGQRCRARIRDSGRGSWAHILADHVLVVTPERR